MKSIRLFSVGIALALVSGSVAQAFDGIRFYNPRVDAANTLRVCYKVSQVKKLNAFSFEVTRHYTGENKLSRVSYGALPETETVTLGSGSPEFDHLMYAFTKGFYACEISWEYGLHWVVSMEEVSGDR